jgi:hypothetical protein
MAKIKISDLSLSHNNLKELQEDEVFKIGGGWVVLVVRVAILLATPSNGWF